MKSIKNFTELSSLLASLPERSRLVVAWPEDDHTREAVAEALRREIVEVTFVGCREQVMACDDLKPFADHFAVEDAADRQAAATRAVEIVRQGGGDILMKGLVPTDVMLRAVLNKETGILPKGRVMTHITAVQTAVYDKLLYFTDAAVIPYPTREQRIEQVRYLAALCHATGIVEPRISLIHCTEQVNTKAFPFLEEYGELKEMAARGEFGDVIVDGPLDVKTSINLHSMQTKGIDSPIAGQADALVMPDIEAGNVFYKALTLFPGTETAAILQGPQAPVVLPSRSDSVACKFNSIAMAAISTLKN